MEVKKTLNLAQIIAATAATYPEKNAIVFESTAYTFRDISREVNRAARVLVGLGVRKGDRVAMQLPKSMEFILLHLANLTIGGITLPLNTAYKGNEVEYFLRDSESSLFITDGHTYRDLKDVIHSIENLACMLTDVKADGVRFYREEINNIKANKKSDYTTRADDIAIICYTSGTTGRPKGALITHRNLVDNMRALKQAWQWTEADVLLHILPIFHVHGLNVALMGGLYAGSTIIMHEKFEPSKVWHTIAEKKCTMLMGVPTMYHRLLNQWEDFVEKSDVRSMRVFISGSAPLSENHFAWFEKAVGHRILERYGMTETGMNTSNPYDPSGRKAGSVGYPLAGVEIRVLDMAGNDVRPGQIGEICLRGTNVFKGYWQNPEKTKEAFIGSWFKSGDLGYQDPNDHMRLYIVGRIKEMIITGGYNVYPKEVENVIERFAGVSETAVFGVADEDLGEKVIAVVVPADDAGNLEETALIAFCKKSLAGYKCPKRFFFRRELPRTATGKLQKHVLKEIYSDS